MDLAALRTCTRCALSATRQRVVIGAGPLDARLMVVGEAPGRSEDEGGAPFVGRSGQLLTRLVLEEVGLERSQYFITNAVKCRPPNNRPPRPDERAACAPWLASQLRDQRPVVVLCVGATAARAVFGVRSPLRDVHGQWLEAHGVRGLVTYHPAAALRGGPNVEAMMRADLALVKAALA
jgi:DNA polymerase